MGKLYCTKAGYLKLDATIRHQKARSKMYALLYAQNLKLINGTNYHQYSQTIVWTAWKIHVFAVC